MSKQAKQLQTLKAHGFVVSEKRLQAGGFFHYIVVNKYGVKYRVTTTGAVKQLPLSEQ